jgi:hypothetical protein
MDFVVNFFYCGGFHPETLANLFSVIRSTV